MLARGAVPCWQGFEHGEGMPLLTIIVPFWELPNELLQRALRSIERGAPSGTLVIVVDNASTNPPHCKTQVISLPRRVTVGAARNAGLAAVRTPYCLFLDADDELLPHGASALLNFVRCNRLHVGAGRMLGCREGTSESWQWGYPPTWAWRFRVHRRILGFMNVYKNVIPVVGAAVLQTDFLRLAGGFGDSNRGEDWTLSAHLGLAGHSALLDFPCLLVHVRPDSLSTRDESEKAARETRRNVRHRLYQMGPAEGLLALSAVPIHRYTAYRRARYSHWKASGRPGALHT